MGNISEHERNWRDLHTPIPLGGMDWSQGPFPWEQWHLPGTGSPDMPPNAPNDQQDTSTQADKRMAGTWGEQEYYGAKPGKQTGTMVVSDGRDIRKPLPSAPCPGGNCGPIRFGDGGRVSGPEGWSLGDGNGNWTGPAYPPAGPWPLKANPSFPAVTMDGREILTWVDDPSNPGESETERSHGQDSGTTDDPDSLWDQAKDFINDAWDSPLGIVAGVAAIAGAVVIGALLAPAAITLAGVAAIMGTALVAGAAANLIVGAADVAMGGMAGNAIDSIAGGAVTNVARGVRDAFNTATMIVEVAALALGIAGIAGAVVGAGGIVKLGASKIDDVAMQAAKRKAKMDAVRATGRAGEDPVGKLLDLVRNYTPFGPKGKQRVPDFIDAGKNAWHEVKNWKDLSLIEQLVDTHRIAQGEGYSYHLWVRGDTKLSKPLLRKLLENDDFFLHYIPGT